MVYENILQAIGNTPIIKLNNMTDEDSATILVKYEGLNVGGSIKTRTAYNMIVEAEKQGLLNKADDKKRAISIAKKAVQTISVPLVGTVTAGSPILAVENLEGYYPLPYDYKSESDLFMLRVRGESMINAGILDGDKIIVKKQETAENGDIIVALI